MTKAGSIVMLSEPHHNQVFESYKYHNDAHRNDTKLVLLEIIRKSHPSYHVTCTTPGKCDLLATQLLGMQPRLWIAMSLLTR
jgi:hypothetical protein